VNPFFTEVRETLLPRPGARHGPLPPLLVGLTLVTGLVDAFSYLVLGHVFVANMTGNVVFFGFALVGAAGFSIAASALALVSFGLGALAGGRAGARWGAHRGRLLSAAVAIQATLLGVSVILAAVSGSPVSAGYRYPLIVIMSLAMGLQNATARKLAVPDLTTTVLTLTIVGIAADSTIAGGHPTTAGRRSTSVVAMFLGALIGAVFVVHVSIVLPLVVALVLLVAIAVTAVTAHVLERADDAAWVQP
jgi:uncharacterized membrane protein YoaK (UPF0700 family)